MFFLCAMSTARGQDQVVTGEGDLVLANDQLIILDIALQELRTRGVNPERYKAVLYKHGSATVVLFEHPDVDSKQRGSHPDLLSYSIEIDADYRVIKGLSPNR